MSLGLSGGLQSVKDNGKTIAKRNEEKDNKRAEFRKAEDES